MSIDRYIKRELKIDRINKMILQIKFRNQLLPIEV